MQSLWPKAEFGVGPTVENGFYYDVSIPGITLTPEDLRKVESEMKKLVKRGHVYEKKIMPIDEAIALFKKLEQPYKVELLHDLKRAGPQA